jgi:predicted Holliday junction resolvase-like endonuclease
VDIAVGVLSGIIAILIGIIVILRESLKRRKEDIYTLQDRISNLEFRYAENAKKSLSTQRSVIKGQLAEQLYPLAVDCPYTLSDMKFIGMPIDYIIFDGYTLCKDGEGDIKEIIFADIKTGKATLSPHQRAIKDAVNAGRVRWETINL